MRSKLPLFLLIGLATLVLPACGGGGGGGDDEVLEPVPPTIASIDPDRGSTDGGTEVLIQGSGFLAEEAGEPVVTFGGIPATDVFVISDVTLSATSPARFAGLADVTVSTSHGEDSLDDGFRYMIPPQITLIRNATTFAFNPEGPMSGGTIVMIQGQQLAPSLSAPPRVFFGTVEAQIETAVSANLIRVIAPTSSVAGLVDIRVTNDFGSAVADNAFRYVAPVLYAADGKGVNGSLYKLNPQTGALSEIGAIGYAVDAMALSPEGILYAVTWQSPANSITAKLLIIDTDTGEGQEVADLQVAGTNGQQMRIDDLTFVGDELYGWARNYGRAVKVDTATGDTEVLGANADFVLGLGEGIASDANENVLAQLQSANGSLWAVDVVLESWVEDQNIFGAGFTGLSQPGSKAMAFFMGSLYGIVSEHSNGSELNQSSYLVTINPSNGLVSGFIELDESIDAIAGSQK